MKTTLLGIALFCGIMFFSSPAREAAHSVMTSLYAGNGGQYIPDSFVGRPSIRAGELGALRSRLYSQLVAFREAKANAFEHGQRDDTLDRSAFMQKYPPISSTAPEAWPALERGDRDLGAQVSIKNQIARLLDHEGLDSSDGFRRDQENIPKDWKVAPHRSDDRPGVR